MIRCKIYGFEEYEGCYFLISADKEISGLPDTVRVKLPGEPVFRRNETFTENDRYSHLDIPAVCRDLKEKGFHFSWEGIDIEKRRIYKVEILHICMHCKKVMRKEIIELKSDETPIESHGLCRKCRNKYYSEFFGKKPNIRMLKEQGSNMRSEKKPRGYWNLKNTLKEAGEIKKKYKLKRLPHALWLVSHGYSALSNNISKHGGFPFIRKLLGEKPLGTKSIKSLPDAIKAAHAFLEKEVDENGERFKSLPPQSVLAGKGYAGLANAISEFGGFKEFRKKAGFPAYVNKDKPPWKNLNHCLEYAKEIKKKHNLTELPGPKKLREMGYKTFVTAIGHYQKGGVKAIKKMLGEKIQTTERKPHGYWNRSGNVIKEIEMFFREHPEYDRLPNSTILTKLGFNQLCYGILKNGGFYNIRKLLGEKPKRKRTAAKYNQWKDIEFTMAFAEKILEKHKLRKLPSQRILYTLGYSSLYAAIYKYHGGIEKFRKILEEKIKK